MITGTNRLCRRHLGRLWLHTLLVSDAQVGDGKQTRDEHGAEHGHEDAECRRGQTETRCRHFVGSLGQSVAKGGQYRVGVAISARLVSAPVQNPTRLVRVSGCVNEEVRGANEASTAYVCPVRTQ
jgi:hypothetical protein